MYGDASAAAQQSTRGAAVATRTAELNQMIPLKIWVNPSNQLISGILIPEVAIL